jgi:hypothetical protein
MPVMTPAAGAALAYITSRHLRKLRKACWGPAAFAFGQQVAQQFAAAGVCFFCVRGENAPNRFGTNDLILIIYNTTITCGWSGGIGLRSRRLQPKAIEFQRIVILWCRYFLFIFPQKRPETISLSLRTQLVCRCAVEASLSASDLFLLSLQLFVSVAWRRTSSPSHFMPLLRHFLRPGPFHWPRSPVRRHRFCIVAADSANASALRRGRCLPAFDGGCAALLVIAAGWRMVFWLAPRTIRIF